MVYSYASKIYYYQKPLAIYYSIIQSHKYLAVKGEIKYVNEHWQVLCHFFTDNN